jgi:selenocysteine lyase/cysteine desulfurase
MNTTAILTTNTTTSTKNNSIISSSKINKIIYTILSSFKKKFLYNNDDEEEGKEIIDNDDETIVLDPSFINTDCTGTGFPYPKLDYFIQKYIMPYYCNVHSDSMCSKVMSEFIEYTRAYIRKRTCKGSELEYAVIFTGNGATCASRHFSHLINYNIDVIVFSVLEHYSNSLMWVSVLKSSTSNKVQKHCIPVIEETGQINISVLKSILFKNKYITYDTYTKKYTIHKRILLAFTACSNVTGVVQPIDEIATFVTSIKKKTLFTKNECLLLCVDYASYCPYLPISLITQDYSIDAGFLSPHKFKGGHSTPGILLVKRSIVQNKVPFFPGGGTACLCTKQVHFYNEIEKREEGGTPNIIGIIKCYFLFKLKKHNQTKIIEKIQHVCEKTDTFFKTYKENYFDYILTPLGKHVFKLPIYSFQFKVPIGSSFTPNMIITRLSDKYNIQARSGISCCALLANSVNKYTGWIRLSFFYDFNDTLLYYIYNSILDLKNTYIV